ncbi:hypothetical protein [Raineyella sp. W15-4]|uniref:hypothetical protein n=1 Tax=Raineyella sp. W15-4 TaxID=3081651 RepID=UPI00295462D8|nr:hypothetical protein [Raineyella sp. W15-4]WOQ17261.1 hypothetical protein R0145_00685 [Raineyella sp. W15-4]
MPTTRKRTLVTHSPSVEHALEVAARHWPGEPDSALLTRLALRGASDIETDDAEALAEERHRILAGAGTVPGIYGPGYLEDLRAERPE